MFENDKRHGKGKFVYTDGEMYDGGELSGNKAIPV